MRRLLAMLMAISILIGQIPVGVFAEGEPEEPAEVLEAELTPEETQEEELPAEEEAPEAELPEEKPDAEAEVPAQVQIEPDLVLAVPEASWDSLDAGTPAEKLNAFLHAGGIRPTPNSVEFAGAKLTGFDKVVYSRIVEAVTQIAAGTREDAVVTIPLSESDYAGKTWTAQDLGVASIVVDGKITDAAQKALTERLLNNGRTVRAALRDCPYEMYWAMNKWNVRHFVVGAKKVGDAYVMYVPETREDASGQTVENFTAVSFSAAPGYEGTGANQVDSTKTAAASHAVAEAKKIVSEHASKTDMQKLDAYQNAICSLNTYNSEAAATTGVYGDPWQIIYVFDGDPDTNVVCEGYAKAFQYLCELSRFKEKIQVYAVTGTLTWPNGGGNHMWNIVHMEKGGNYLVDVTNSDAGEASDGLLFMQKPDSGDVETGYIFGSFKFTYDDSARTVYTLQELTLTDVIGPETRGELGDTLTWEVTEQNVLVITGTGAIPAITDAPWKESAATIKAISLDSRITAIGANAFAGCTAVTELTIPAAITVIGASAFAGCTGVKTIAFAGSAPKIGTDAFKGITAYVSYPAGDHSWVASVMQNYGGQLTWQKPTFGTCGDKLTWEVTGNTLTITGTGTMSDFAAGEAPWKEFTSDIQVVTLAEGVASVGSNAFAGITGVAKIDLPSGIASIGASAFSGCTGLKTLILPASLKTIGKDAFTGCAVEFLYIDSVASWLGVSFGNTAANPISDTARAHKMYVGSQLLTELAIPEGTPVPAYAFTGTGISKLTVGKCASMGENAFTGCTSLKEITFTGDAPNIASNAFTGVAARVSYNLANTTWTAAKRQNYGGELTWLGSTSGTCGKELTWSLDSNGALVISGSGPMTDFTTAPWAGYTVKTVTIGEHVETIGGNAFKGNAQLASITIPAGVNAIGSSAFAACSALKTITFLGDAPVIANSAFTSVTAAATFPTGNTTWTRERQLDYGGHLTWNGKPSYARSGSVGSNLSWSISDENVLTISGTGAMVDFAANGAPWAEFQSVITAIVLENRVTTVGANAFAGCTAVTELTIPGNITSIGANAFAGCTNVKTIAFAGNAPAIGTDAFKGITANVSYNLAASGWTDSVCQNYGGKLTWLGTASGTCGSKLTWTLDSTGLLAITGTGAMTEFTTAPWSKLTGIIKTVTIGEGVTTIGRNAFANCTALTSVSIPASVTAIGASAFSGCSSLTAVVLPAGITAIADSCFANCAALKAITIPASVTSIGAAAFNGCTGLTAVTVPETVTSIGASAFNGCSGVKTVTLPEGLKTIGANAFAGCTAVETLNIPTVESWLAVSFANANANPLSGGSNHKIYVNHQLLKELVLADTVKTIPLYAFRGCSDLTAVTFGSGVATIGDNAFGGTGVKTMTFTGDAPRIADSAFTGVTALAVYSLANKTWTASLLKDYGGKITWQGQYKGTFGDLTWQLDDSGVLTVSGNGSMNSLIPWKDLAASITRVVIEEGVTDISKDAFRGCVNLTSVQLPASMQTIGQYAFRECTALVSLNLGGTRTISDWAFYKCTALTDLVIPAATVAMGSNAFRECSGLVNLNLGKLTEIPEWAFYNCTSLAEVTVPETVHTIGSGAFRGCTALRDVNLGKVQLTGEASFYGCTALTQITIPSTLQTLGKATFGECTALASVSFLGGGAIGERAFYRCSALKTLTLPAGVDSVGPYAFDGCTNLEQLTFRGTAPAMDRAAFGGAKAGMLVVFYPEGGNLGSWANVAYKDYGGKPQWLCWVEVSTEDALAAALKVDGFKVIRVVGNLTLTKQLTIPAGKQVAVIGTMTLVSGVSIVNNGIITVGESGKIVGYHVTITEAPAELRSGSVADLKAEVNIANVDEEQIVWSLKSGDEAYAMLSGSRLLAKDVTVKKEITLIASSSKGYAAEATRKVMILPVIKGVKILRDGEDVTGGDTIVNVNTTKRLQLRAVCDPEDSVSQIQWSSSSDVCTLVPGSNGSCTVVIGALPSGKSLSVKLTAKDAASSKAGEYILRLVAAASDLKIEGSDTLELVGGQSYTLKASPVFGEKDVISDRSVVWTLADKDTSYAAITAEGKLTTKTVGTKVELEAVAFLNSNPDVRRSVKISLLPVTSSVEITSGGKAVEDILFVAGSTVQLGVNTMPLDAAKTGTWKSSSVSIAEVTQDGLVTFKKNGKVTITFTAADGSKKKDTAVLLHGNPVTAIDITAGKTELTSGGKTTLKAEVNADATMKTLVWTSSDPDVAAVSKTGAVTAKTVYEQKIVIITAEAGDGSGVEKPFLLTVKPKAGVMAIRNEAGDVVNGTTQLADVNASEILFFSAEPGATWTSSSTKVAEVHDGAVRFNKPGSVTITAKSEDGKRTGKVTVKYAVPVESLAITAKGTAYRTAPDGTILLASGKGKVTLTAVPTNADASVKKVTWTSSNPSVASISSTGAVSAKAGILEATEVLMTAAATDGSGKTAVQRVVVNPVATHVSIVAAEAVPAMNLSSGEVVTNRTLLVNGVQTDTVKLAARVYPAAVNADVSWKSSNLKIATVEDGVVSLKDVGTVTITATVNDGSGKSSQMKLYVGAYPSNIQLLETGPIVVTSGAKVTPRILPTYQGMELPTITVGFSLRPCDAQYASVSDSGVVTAKKVTEKHDIVVTAFSRSDPSVSLQIPITVIPAAASVRILLGGEEVNGKTLNASVGSVVRLSAVIEPLIANQSVTWSVSSAAAKVDKDGNVTGVKAGTVTVTAKAADGSGKTAKVTIKFA